MINYLKGKLGLKHDHYINAKKLFKHYDFGGILKCTICNKRLR